MKQFHFAEPLQLSRVSGAGSVTPRGGDDAAANIHLPVGIVGHLVGNLRYLEEFGYLPKPSGAAAMLSKTVVEEAIRELQLYGNVPVTGKIDAATRELMTRKRCGLPDRQMKMHRMRHRKRYALMGPIWDKKLLTYR
uniref:PG_binding_1 domain-containing protein n=1 Tax=Ascaris lumbricoides TaxID=6252 RepID=A0A0M3HUN9_ASCLU